MLAASAIHLPDGATLTPLGITGLPDGMTLEDTLALTRDLLSEFNAHMQIGNVLMWAVGDAYAHGERLHGEDFEEAMASTGYAPQTISNAVWVARKVAHRDRRGDLSWTHHECIASLKPEHQRTMLARAAEEELSTRDLADQVRAYKDRQMGIDPDVGRARRSLVKAAEDVRAVEPENWVRELIGTLLFPLRAEADKHGEGAWRRFLLELRVRIEDLLKGV